jgi:hypothetical protein
MPRLSLGQLPAYRRHKASGQAIVTLDGRDHYLGTWKSAESKNEYRRITKEWQNGAVAQADSAELTVTELLAAFGRHAQDYYRDAESKRCQALFDFVLLRLNREDAELRANLVEPIPILGCTAGE